MREEIWSRVGQWGDCHCCGKKLHKKVSELAGRWERAQQQLADKVSSTDTFPPDSGLIGSPVLADFQSPLGGLEQGVVQPENLDVRQLTA